MDDITRISGMNDYGTRPRRLLHCRMVELKLDEEGWMRREKKPYLEVSQPVLYTDACRACSALRSLVDSDTGA